MSHASPASQLSCMAKTLTVDIMCKQFSQLIFFIPVILIGTVDLYHFIPHSLMLTLPGGHKVSTEQSILCLFSTLCI